MLVYLPRCLQQGDTAPVGQRETAFQLKFNSQGWCQYNEKCLLQNYWQILEKCSKPDVKVAIMIITFKENVNVWISIDTRSLHTAEVSITLILVLNNNYKFNVFFDLGVFFFSFFCTLSCPQWHSYHSIIWSW